MKSLSEHIYISLFVPHVHSFFQIVSMKRTYNICNYIFVKTFFENNQNLSDGALLNEYMDIEKNTFY